MLTISLSAPPSGTPLANLDGLEVDLMLKRVGLPADRIQEVWPGLQVPGLDERAMCWFRPNSSLEAPLLDDTRALIFLPGLEGERVAADVLYLLHSTEARCPPEVAP